MQLVNTHDVKEQVQIQDETATAKDIVRVIRQAEDNYQVERSIVDFHWISISFLFFLASDQRKLSRNVGINIPITSSTITNDENQDRLEQNYIISTRFWT